MMQNKLFLTVFIIVKSVYLFSMSRCPSSMLTISPCFNSGTYTQSVMLILYVINGYCRMFGMENEVAFIAHLQRRTKEFRFIMIHEKKSFLMYFNHVVYNIKHNGTNVHH